MSPRTGRPKADNPKNYIIKARFDEETYRAVTDYCKKHNITRTDAIRLGLKLLLSEEEK
ncbi:CopG family transcriptional regulator [Paenibacillus oralis]|uniref:CopG family transcriptional regulator n=1 Tax=Paenibacillus oralis TaxID=2490856 RepID=A0A3P3UAK8_9BACL|nr:CopG family transcriptional regulator [Paenibacillus oralis]